MQVELPEPEGEDNKKEKSLTILIQLDQEPLYLLAINSKVPDLHDLRKNEESKFV